MLDVVSRARSTGREGNQRRGKRRSTEKGNKKEEKAVRGEREGKKSERWMLLVVGDRGGREEN